MAEKQNSTELSSGQSTSKEAIQEIAHADRRTGTSVGVEVCFFLYFFYNSLSKEQGLHKIARRANTSM